MALTVLSMHILNAPDEGPATDDIIVELSPERHGRPFWSGELGERAEE